MMSIKKFLAGPIGTNVYLLINDETKEGVLVDPADCPARLRECVEREGIRIRAILLTHAHFDHIMGIDDAIRAFGPMPVYVHDDDIPMLAEPTLNLSFQHGMDYSYNGAVSVRDGQILLLAGLTFRVIHTPGHTPGGACYYLESEGVLISGDTLFQESVGRTDFPGGSMLELVRSIKGKLLVLPEETRVYPGHMGTTTIGHEKLYNPCL